MVFNDEEYTIEKLLKQFIAVENHAVDGSVLDAGCHCVEGKHLLGWELYAEEGSTIMSEAKKKEFLMHLGDLARSLRRNMEADSWDMHKALHEAGLNPFPRQYLPHGLTECERNNPKIAHELTNCIRKVEHREKCKPPYDDCPVNPVAVCRASIKCS